MAPGVVGEPNKGVYTFAKKSRLLIKGRLRRDHPGGLVGVGGGVDGNQVEYRLEFSLEGRQI